jgi:hypothetical protein
LAAAPMLRDCISAVTPCPGQNAFIETNVITPLDPQNLRQATVSPEQPPTTGNRD